MKAPMKYMHDNFKIRTVHMHPNEPVNGHSHCKALFLIGEWQRIFAVELDDSRPRRIALQIMGK